MGYRFCFGASGSGKSRKLHEILLEEAGKAFENKERAHENFVLLVPDQYSMQTQKEIVSESPQKGIMNIDVLSFGRLTHKIFEEAGVPKKAALDETGKTLLIRRAAGQCASSLRILGSSVRYPGMIAEVKSVISEFMQYGVSDSEIARMQEFAVQRGQGALSARLADLRILCHAFEEGKRDRFITSEETLDLLAEAIPSSDWIRRSTFVLDGFTGFTPVQYRVIMALVRCAREVTIALTYGQDDGPSIEWVREHGSAGKEDALFFLTRKTVCDIDRMAALEGLKRESDLWADDPGQVPLRFSDNPVLGHLANSIFRYPLAPFKDAPCGKIRLFETDTPEEEVRQVLIEIKRLTLRKGYCYRDVCVVCGDLERYGSLFEKSASGYGIPFYIDKRAGAGLNPLTEAIRSVPEIRPQGYSYAAVFRYLRSGMSGLTREETDVLENYCLEHGIKGRKKWGRSFDADTEPLRLKFLREIEPVAGRIDEERIAPATAAERTKALYAFMTGLSMEEKMQMYSSAFTDEGDYVRGKQFSQLYRCVIDVLEQIHDLLGDENMSASEYAQILDSGLEEIRLGTLPQKADRVLIGDIERTRLSECRVLFFVGVNDGNIPRGASRGGLLSDLDREFLRKSGTELSPTPRQQMCLQRLYLYMNMTKPTDALYLTFSRTTPDGKSLRPSYLVSMIMSLFPQIGVEHPQLLPAAEQLTGVRDSIVWLSGALRDYAQGKTPENSADAAAVKTAYGYLARGSERQTRITVEKLKEAAFLRYDPMRISPGTAEALYGRTVMGGISRLETAAQCRLRQFLQYGIKLQERKEYAVEPADTGSILHQSLDRFGHKLRDKGMMWDSFTPEEGRRLAAESLQEVAASYKDLLMYSTVRSESQLQRMERVLVRSVDTLQYQLRQGRFVPEAYEFSFGPDGEAGAITFPLADGKRLSLVGRIDRLDLCREDGSIFVKILDYKSGSLDLDEDLMRRGIQLQLLMYMNAVMQFLADGHPDEKIVPSAMLYYRIKDPVISGKGADSAGDDDVLAKIRGDLCPTGLVHSDPASYKRLDMKFTKKSSAVPITLMKSGELTATSHVYSQEMFDALSDEVRKFVCSLAEEILSGSAEASPAVWTVSGKERTACDYCPYKSVCGFDPSIDGYRYRER